MIHIDKNNRRINVAAVIEHNGVTYNGNIMQFPDAVAELGIHEIDETALIQPPAEYLTNPDRYVVDSLDDAPYVAYNRRSDESIMQAEIKRYEGALDRHLDAVAQKNRYNDRFTFALRAGYAGPYQAEGLAFAQWMDTVNSQAYQLLQDIVVGKVAPPSLEDFIDGLPEFVPPDNV